MTRLFLVLYTALFSGLLIDIFLPSESYGLPAFSRTMKTPCSTCHTQWPLLNETGRQYLEQGFDTGELLDIAEVDLQNSFPLSARLNLLLIDQRSSKDKMGDLEEEEKQLKLRALHEAAFLVGGKMGDISYFIELGAEDEEEFEVTLEHGYIGWHPLSALNVRVGFASPFGADGRNTLNQHKPARYKWAASAEGFVPGASQVINIYGIFTNLFYSLAWHGNEELSEGNDPQDISGRLAVDFFGASIGGFYTRSKEYDEAVGKSGDETNRYGIDAQWIVNNLPPISEFDQLIQLNAIYAKKDVEEVIDTKDDVIGIFAQYLLLEVDSPWAALAIHFDRYSEADGKEVWTKGAAFLTYFMRENVKIQAGWEGTFKAPEAYDHKESRTTLVIDVGF